MKMERTNMKKFFVALVLAGAMSLGACATTPGTPSSTDPTVAAVQDAAAKACGFVPSISTITGIIAAFFPGGAPINTLVTSVANAICNAIVPPAGNSLRRGPVAGANAPTVAGVKVEGYFIR